MPGSSGVTVAQVGVGYWGPNLIRNFTQLESSEVVLCADLDDERLGHMKRLYPHLETTKDYKEILARDEIEARVVLHEDHFGMVRREPVVVEEEEPVVVGVGELRACPRAPTQGHGVGDKRSQRDVRSAGLK